MYKFHVSILAPTSFLVLRVVPIRDRITNTGLDISCKLVITNLTNSICGIYILCLATATK
jgi:hypothetical protein